MSERHHRMVGDGFVRMPVTEGYEAADKRKKSNNASIRLIQSKKHKLKRFKSCPPNTNFSLQNYFSN